MLSKEEVLYIAHLSRIHLTDDEVERLTKDLTAILGYIDKLSQLDVSRVEPTSHVLPLKNVFREDTVTPSLAQDEVLALAIAHHKGSFKVPQIIE